MPQTKDQKRRGALERFEKTITHWARLIKTHPLPPTHERAKTFEKLAHEKIEKLQTLVKSTKHKLTYA